MHRLMLLEQSTPLRAAFVARRRQTLQITIRHGAKTFSSLAVISAPLGRQQREQALSLDRVIDGLEIDSVASLGFHGPDDIRGLVASEAVRSAALVTVPISSTLAVSVDEDGGQLSVLTPPEMPANVKKAIEVVGGLIQDTPDPQLLILAVLLLWVRKYGNQAWRKYCEALLPPFLELSCLLCYTPGELVSLQLPHLRDEAARQHDWARWAHSQWLSISSGALRRLGLADRLEDTMWALAVVRSRAVEFPVGATAGSGSGSGSTAAGGPGRTQRPVGPVVSVLAPVVDLANHSNDPNCVIQLTTDRSRVVLLPRRPIPAGEPLTVDYGYDRSSLELMADYGFVTTANPYDGDVELPGADKLLPLERPRLEAAARAILRRRQRQRQMLLLAAPQQPPAVAAAAGAEAAEVETEVESEAGREGGGGALAESVLLPGNGEVGAASEAEAEEDVLFSGRLRAAVGLLSPRATLGAGATGGTTPATQRIVAGLWHKLVRHCTDSLPTSLEQDRALLDDILGGRVSGFAAGPALSLDPVAVPSVHSAPPAAVTDAAPAAAPPAAEAASRPPWPLPAEAAAAAAATAERPAKARGRRGQAPQPSAGVTSADAGVAVGGGGQDRVPPENSESGSRSDVLPAEDPTSAAGPATAAAAPATVSEQDSAVQGSGSSAAAGATEADPDAPAPGSRGGGGSSAAGPVCRTARRAGRLYAAVRARVEHKELLAAAEELLRQYAGV